MRTVLRRWRCLLPLRCRSRSWPLSRRRGSSRVSPVYRTVAECNPDTAVWFLCRGWSGVGGRIKQVSLAPTEPTSAVTWRGGLPRPSYRGHSDGRAQVTALGGSSWITLPSASAIAPRLFARWPLARSWLRAGGRLDVSVFCVDAALPQRS